MRRLLAPPDTAWRGDYRTISPAPMPRERPPRGRPRNRPLRAVGDRSRNRRGGREGIEGRAPPVQQPTYRGDAAARLRSSPCGTRPPRAGRTSPAAGAIRRTSPTASAPRTAWIGPSSDAAHHDERPGPGLTETRSAGGTPLPPCRADRPAGGSRSSAQFEAATASLWPSVAGIADEPPGGVCCVGGGSRGPNARSSSGCRERPGQARNNPD